MVNSVLAEQTADHSTLQKPFLELVAQIKMATGLPVPLPDPHDGGIGARFLLLLETPGPTMLSDDIVSRDNQTGTGRNLRYFLTHAGIARGDTLIWNVIPFIIHAPGARNRAPRRTERAAGLKWLPPFLSLLPNLKVIVLAGRHAASALPSVHALRPALPILLMAHPSPTYVCTNPAIKVQIEKTLARAAELLR